MAGYAQVWPDTLRSAGYARAYSASSKLKHLSVYGRPDTLRWSWIRSGWSRIRSGGSQIRSGERIRPCRRIRSGDIFFVSFNFFFAKSNVLQFGREYAGLLKTTPLLSQNGSDLFPLDGVIWQEERETGGPRERHKDLAIRRDSGRACGRLEPPSFQQASLPEPCALNFSKYDS